jgi:hypothetical protein
MTFLGSGLKKYYINFSRTQGPGPYLLKCPSLTHLCESGSNMN